MSDHHSKPNVFNAGMAPRLDKLYSSPQIVEQRRRLRELIRAKPGEAGIDIGCGLGHLSCELAQQVLPGGRLIAIDSSADMISGVTARAQRDGLTDTIEPQRWIYLMQALTLQWQCKVSRMCQRFSRRLLRRRVFFDPVVAWLFWKLIGTCACTSPRTLNRCDAYSMAAGVLHIGTCHDSCTVCSAMQGLDWIRQKLTHCLKHDMTQTHLGRD